MQDVKFKFYTKTETPIKHWAELVHTCPNCELLTHFDFVSTGIGDSIKEVNYIVQCPKCKNYYLAKFKLSGNYEHTFLEIFPKGSFKSTFPKEVKQISPKFIEIYEQAITAKNSDLNELVGIGLRRAFEFLITDYIKNVLLTEPKKTLEQKIEQIDVRNVNVHSTLIRWVGNDTTHTKVTHPEFSVDDMIKSIEIVVYYLHSEYISNELAKKINT